MDSFDRLSAALQVQIVNGLGWTGLRPVQDQTIRTVLDGANCVVLAPTAGGKTEAAFFPLLSAMDSQDWRPVSVLYVAPIRALLNNQESRLERLTGLLGRRAFKWHGDVRDSARRRFIADPTDVLAITPESLEAMLMSTRVPARRLLANLRAVVIDEVHAFARDDRGAHLVALLERVQRICGHDLQRLGLSATVGDPEAIVDWLSGSSSREQVVVNPGGSGVPPELHLDYVGGLDNAALLIDRLYPGTRRLVFVDSRRRVEQLGDLLRKRGVDVYLSHSSLAVSERRDAERAFEEADNCVIVATSSLELGIDVGDLDRVIQVDAPSTVSSVLQRMGRTGRRPGSKANCTFLVTSDDALLQSAALLRLHAQGYVEPSRPGRRASHLLAHQLLALAIQDQGVGTADWWAWLDGCAAFADLTARERESVVEHMLAHDILVEADSRYILGQEGERLYAGRNFLALYAVFSTSPVLTVWHGDREVGAVDAWFLMTGGDRSPEGGAAAFVLAGRAWEIVEISWSRATCRVTPADAGKYPRWMGQPKLLDRVLCQAMRDVLVDDQEDDAWSKRARHAMSDLRDSYSFLHDAPQPVVDEGSRMQWWTFAGGRANNLYAGLLRETLGGRVSANNLSVSFSGGAAVSGVAVREAIRGLPERLSWDAARAMAPDVARGRVSKFQPCLPEDLERDLVARAVVDVVPLARSPVSG